jgi:predicted kinase
MVAATKSITILIGLPYSGKTTIAKSLLNDDTLLIERDAYLEDVRRDPVLVQQLIEEATRIAQPISRMMPTREANAYNDALTLEYVRRVTKAIQETEKSHVIVDGTHLQPLSRSFIKAFPDARKIAIVMRTDPEDCIQRLQRAPMEIGVRSTVTPELIRKMSDVFELPTEGEGFDEITAYPSS